MHGHQLITSIPLILVALYNFIILHINHCSTQLYSIEELNFQNSRKITKVDIFTLEDFFCCISLAVYSFIINTQKDLYSSKIQL